VQRRFSFRCYRYPVMKIGYARVSTLEQNLDLQLQALKQADCKRIFREKVSGIKRSRPEFLRLLDQLRESDTLVVWKLDRLARSTRSGKKPRGVVWSSAQAQCGTGTTGTATHQ
jgi:hypothetical protein